MTGSIYVMTLFDWYSAGFSPMLLAFIEVLVISYAYGKCHVGECHGGGGGVTGSIYVMTLFDLYSAGLSPMLLAFIEVLIISYAYGRC